MAVGVSPVLYWNRRMTKQSWTAVEVSANLWKRRSVMDHEGYKFPPRSEYGSQFGTTDFEPLLNSHQAAALLRIHHKTLQKIARRGEIHGTHIGKMWRFRASDLDEWVNRERRRAS
jgi:excisionase family DNA binding protein